MTDTRYLMSKDERVLDRERNKMGDTAESIMKKNLLKIKRQKNPNAEIVNHEIKDYLSNPAKVPFMIDQSKRQQGKKNTLVAKSDFKIESKHSEDYSQGKSEDNSNNDIPQEDDKISLRDRGRRTGRTFRE